MVTDSLLDLFKANSTGNYAFKPRNTLVSCKVFHPILFQWLVLGSSLALRFISCSNRENRSLALLKMAMSQKRKHEDLRMLDLVIATRENTAKLGYFVDDTVVNPGLGIPYYKTVTWTPLFYFGGARFDSQHKLEDGHFERLLKLASPHFKGCFI
jgi:hypothetical protein